MKFRCSCVRRHVTVDQRSTFKDRPVESSAGRFVWMGERREEKDSEGLEHEVPRQVERLLRVEERQEVLRATPASN